MQCCIGEKESDKIEQTTHSISICHVSCESKLFFWIFYRPFQSAMSLANQSLGFCYTLSFHNKWTHKNPYTFLFYLRGGGGGGKKNGEGKVNKRRKDNVEMIRAGPGKSIAGEKNTLDFSLRESAHDTKASGEGAREIISFLCTEIHHYQRRRRTVRLLVVERERQTERERQM